MGLWLNPGSQSTGVLCPLEQQSQGSHRGLRNPGGGDDGAPQTLFSGNSYLELPLLRAVAVTACHCWWLCPLESELLEGFATVNRGSVSGEVSVGTSVAQDILLSWRDQIKSFLSS